MHIWYINSKVLTKYYTIWHGINGHMDIYPITNRLYISILYRFPVTYIYFDKTNNI